MAWDRGTIGGVVLAIGAIAFGLWMEGGRVTQILQPTAALIVFGGTLGAVMVHFPFHQVREAGVALRELVLERAVVPEAVISQLVSYANQARKRGIISLDAELENIADPFLRRALMLAVDGMAPQELRKLIEVELENDAEADERIPQVFEAAGGYSPTIGIIGAVLGLIQVMQHLENIDEVGKGIAVAFVATVYGVGAANLLLLPAAGKLRIRLRNAQLLRQMMLEGVVCLLQGMNPRILQMRLSGFLLDNKQVKEGN